MPWKLTMGDKSINEDDLTLAECELIEQITGENWGNIHPLNTARHARAVVQVLFARTDPADAEKRSGLVKVGDLLKAFTVVEDDLPTEFDEGIPPVGDGGATVG